MLVPDVDIGGKSSFFMGSDDLKPDTKNIIQLNESLTCEKWPSSSTFDIEITSQ